MTTDLTIPNTILAQLGGTRFRVMTGARDFLGSDRALICRLMRNERGVTHLRVTLTDADVYHVEALRVNRHGDTTVVDQADDVYNDQLVEAVERITGLALRL